MSDPSIGKAALQITIDKAQVASEADAAVTPALTTAAQNAAKLIAGLAVGREIASAGKAGVDELIERQTVAAQTQVQLRNESGITTKAIDDLGESMMHLAGFDDEAAKSAANVLLRFGAIHDEGTLKRIESDAADLAKTMGTDLPSAAQTLGQVLQDPENSARKLRPLIGALTDAQKEQIKAFNDSGDAIGAQNVILSILEQRIGGAAAAYGGTLAGSLDKFHAQAKETEASLAEGLAPAEKFAADAATHLLSGIEGLPGPLRAVAGLAIGATTAVVGIAQPIAGLVSSFNQIRAARILSATATTVDTEATAANAAANVADAAAITAAAEAEALLATNSAAAVAGLYAEGAAAGAAAGESAGLLAALGPLAVPAAIIAGVVAIGSALGLFGSTTKNAEEEVEALAGTTNDKLLKSFDDLDALSKALTFRKLIDGGKDTEGTLIRLRDSTQQGSKEWERFNDALTTNRQKQADAAAAADQNKAALDGLSGSTEGLLTEQQKTDLIQSMTDRLQAQKDTLDKLKQGYDDALTAQNGLIDAQLGAQGSDLARRDAEARLADAQDALAKAQGGTAADPQKIRDAQIAAEEGQKSLAAALKKGDQVAADSARNRIDKANEAAAAAAGAGADPKKVADAQRAAEHAQLDLTRATAAQAKSQADLNKTSLEAAGQTETNSQYTQDYVGQLKGLADQASGPTKDALEGLIGQLQTASGTYATKLSQELSINGYTLTAQEVQGLIDKGLGINAVDIARQQQIDTGNYLVRGHFASGGFAPAGMTFRHGEQGRPELAILGDGVSKLNQDAYVLTHEQSMGLFGGSGKRGGDVNITGPITLGAGTNRSTLAELADMLRVEQYLSAA